MEKKNQVLEFFEICQQNKTKLIKQKNLIIDKLLRIKKNNSSKEEYLDYRDAWNKKREESPDEKNRRECEEILDEIKEEKKFVEKLTKDMKREKEKMEKVKKEVEEIIQNGKVNEFVKRDEYNSLVESYNVLVNQHNEMMSNYVKKEEIKSSIPAKHQVIQPPSENKVMKQVNLTSEQVKQLEEWTSLKCSDIVFDSNVDNWSKNTSVFDKRIIGKKRLVFLIEDDRGEKFGYYLNTEVVEKYHQYIETDNKSFEFNLQSNGRLKHPMKFEIKDLEKGGYHLYEKSDDYLITLGDIVLFKENKKNKSCCFQRETQFDYHGTKNALCGKTGWGTPFTSKRILVIQMK